MIQILYQIMKKKTPAFIDISSDSESEKNDFSSDISGEDKNDSDDNKGKDNDSNAGRNSKKE